MENEDLVSRIQRQPSEESGLTANSKKQLQNNESKYDKTFSNSHSDHRKPTKTEGAPSNESALCDSTPQHLDQNEPSILDDFDQFDDPLLIDAHCDETPRENEDEGTYEELVCLVRQFYVEKPINPAALAHQNIETC